MLCDCLFSFFFGHQSAFFLCLALCSLPFYRILFSIPFSLSFTLFPLPRAIWINIISEQCYQKYFSLFLAQFNTLLTSDFNSFSDEREIIRREDGKRIRHSKTIKKQVCITTCLFAEFKAWISNRRRKPPIECIYLFRVLNILFFSERLQQLAYNFDSIYILSRWPSSSTE